MLLNLFTSVFTLSDHARHLLSEVIFLRLPNGTNSPVQVHCLSVIHSSFSIIQKKNYNIGPTRHRHFRSFSIPFENNLPSLRLLQPSSVSGARHRQGLDLKALTCPSSVLRHKNTSLRLPETIIIF